MEKLDIRSVPASEQLAACYYLTKIGYYEFMVQIAEMINPGYTGQHPVDTALTGIEKKYQAMREYYQQMPTHFGDGIGLMKQFVLFGWCEKVRGNYGRWNKDVILSLLGSTTVKEFIGPQSWMLLHVNLYFQYQRSVLAKLKLDENISTEKAIELIIADKKNLISSYSQRLYEEGQKHMTGAELIGMVQTHMEETMRDCFPSQRLITMLVVRAYLDKEVPIVLKEIAHPPQKVRPVKKMLIA